MKYIKKFNEEIDKASIEYWCKRYYLEAYIINDDGTVDVDYDVELARRILQKIPIKFGVVNANFDCSNNELTSLVGSPRKVNESFYCHNNQLTSLEGGPEEVNDNYNCCSNKLISLDGLPKEINEMLIYCFNNPVHEIIELFRNYEGYINSLDYNYLRGNNIIKLRFQEACEEANVKVPESIPGYKYI